MEDKELIRLLARYMPADHSQCETPDPLLVLEARFTVASRKNMRASHAPFLRFRDQLLALLTPVQAGLAATIVISCYLFIGQADHGVYHNSKASSPDAVSASICNTTMSVISYTMLTSIPTLRN